MMEFVNGKDDIPYMKWKIKFMFETTNQLLIYIYILKKKKHHLEGTHEESI